MCNLHRLKEEGIKKIKKTLTHEQRKKRQGGKESVLGIVRGCSRLDQQKFPGMVELNGGERG